MTTNPISVAVLISGNGSNLQAIIDNCSKGAIAARVCCVISNEAGAYGLERARRSNIPTHVVPHTRFPDRTRFDAELLRILEHYDPDLIVLAGFMRILGADFVARYAYRIINIHPSLLPKYKGVDTHARVLAAGDKVHGATVHFVTADLDSGPIIVQASVPVEPTDTVETLETKVHGVEHEILPKAIGWIAEDRTRVVGDRVRLDDLPVGPRP